jgi:type I restriction enzyme S subunit
MSQVKQITPVGVVPKAWIKSTLESVSKFITKGSTPTTFGFDWVESGIPFLRSECVTDNGFNMKGLSYISNEAHEYMVRSKIVAGDILISITGNVGRIAIFPKELVEGNINQHIARVRINEPNECDEGFVYYQINQVLYRQYYYGIVTGAAYPQLSLKQIRETPIYLPPLPTQKRIASILSAYDDLIENNLKRIKLLEEIAQRTYDEWFVKFRVYGEQLPMDEVTGLPVGWERKSMSSIGDFINGFAFKPSDFLQIGKPIIKIKEMKNGIGNDTPLNDGSRVPSKYLIKRGDLLFSWSGSLEVVIWRGIEGWLNQHLFKVVPKKDIPMVFLHQSLLFVLNEFNNLTTGSTMKHIKRKELDFVTVPVPNTRVISDFDKIISPVQQQILNLSNQIQLLKQSRDILLPRLMSGTINVES